jgi:transcriptional accessory protein Tex/SPT6
MDTNVLETPSETGEIKRKMHFTGTVVKTTLAGAIVDIGIGVPGILHVSQIQKDPVNRVEDVLQIGQTIEVWVRKSLSGKKDRVELTMIRPLDLEWRELKKDMVVKGKVTRLEKFGAFVDIGAERPGLIHISELTHGFIRSPEEIVKEGDDVEVKILDIDRKKKQIKLSMKALEAEPVKMSKSGGKEKEREKEAEAPVEEDKPIPTAMEMAFMEAQQRAKGHDDEPRLAVRPKAGKPKSELDNLLSRTLEHKKQG